MVLILIPRACITNDVMIQKNPEYKSEIQYALHYLLQDRQKKLTFFMSHLYCSRPETL